MNDHKTPLLASSTEPPATSDFWTKISALSLLPGVVSDCWLIGNVVDVALGLTPKIFGLSEIGLISGAVGSLFFTVGTMYCQYALNSNNQYYTNSGTASRKNSSCCKNLFNYSMLLGDWGDTALYKAGPIVYLAKVVFPTLTREQQLYIWGGAAGFGLFSSIADMRTSKNNIMPKKPENVSVNTESNTNSMQFLV